MTFDTKAFRHALGSFPTGVAVVTAMTGAEPVGITVNSFTSVSLDPPLVLWCLKKDSHRYKVFADTDAFTINVLGTEHESVSSRLARQGEHSLKDIALLETELGPPALADAHAMFECARESVHEAGDHLILVGRVLRFARRDDGAPLVYYRGRYGALSG
jgi:flavin reductase (DIM6/NTAB) family NADH-FMN oxidoreductase RutF